MFCFALHRGQETACIPFGTPGDTSTAARTPNGPKIRPSRANRFSLRFFRSAIMPAATMQTTDTVDSAMLSTILICSENTASSTPSLAQRDNPLALCVRALRNPGQRGTAQPDRWRMGGGSLWCTVGALTTSRVVSEYARRVRTAMATGIQKALNARLIAQYSPGPSAGSAGRPSRSAIRFSRSSSSINK